MIHSFPISRYTVLYHWSQTSYMDKHCYKYINSFYPRDAWSWLKISVILPLWLWLMSNRQNKNIHNTDFTLTSFLLWWRMRSISISRHITLSHWRQIPEMEKHCYKYIYSFYPTELYLWLQNACRFAKTNNVWQTSKKLSF